MKTLHMLCALLTILGFIYRASLRLRFPDRPLARWLKIAPHIIDTCLLLSAIYLLITLGYYPAWFNWVSAKLVGLLAYILFGFMTLRFSQTRTAILSWLSLAVLSFAYIIAVARTKQAWPLML